MTKQTKAAKALQAIQAQQQTTLADVMPHVSVMHALTGACADVAPLADAHVAAYVAASVTDDVVTTGMLTEAQAQYAADKLDMLHVLLGTDVADALHDALDAEHASVDMSTHVTPVVAQALSANSMSAKAWLHVLFNKRNADNTHVRYTLKMLCALTGKTEVNVRTQLSDMRTTKYCGKHGVLMTTSTRVAGVTWYHIAD